MKIFLLILILIFSVIIQTTLIPFLSVMGAGPDLVLVLILIIVVNKGYQKVWPCVILIGFLLDLLSGLPFGLISLGLVSAAYLVDWFSRNIFSGTKLWMMANLVILGSLAYNLFLFALSGIFQADSAFSFKYLLVEVIYNLAIVLIFYAGFKKILRKI